MNMRKAPFGRPIIGEEERQAVLEALEDPILVHGPRAKAFEADFCKFTGAPNAISVSSCTAALHLSYFYLGLGEGDEVIVPAQTHSATAHAVELCGAKPVFVDAELETGNIDIAQIESAITENTKALSVVHYLGVPVDMVEINMIAQKYDLFVVEDCALATGTYVDGVHAGLLGDVGCYSFYPVKHMTTAEGGMLITKHEDVAVRIERQRAFGVDRTHGERKVPGVYDVNQLGFNYRMNELQAALGIEQLKKLPGFLQKRRENFATLKNALSQIEKVSVLDQPCNERFQSSFYCMSVLLDESLVDRRFEITSLLKENNVGTSVYYPKPVPHMTYYQKRYGYSKETFPNASRISYHGISLPVGPHLNEEDMEYVAEQLNNAIKKV